MRKDSLRDREEELVPASFQLPYDPGPAGNTRTSSGTKSTGDDDEVVSADSGPYNPYVKPTLPYWRLIEQALRASPAHALSLRDIYTWMEVTYPYYLYDQSKSWKNAVRHNLSIQKAFRKVPRRPGSDEKSCLWELTGERGINRRVQLRRASEPVMVVPPPTHDPYMFRPIRSMPMPPMEKVEKPQTKRKRRFSEPSANTEPVPILPKTLFFEDQPIRITSPMLASSLSLGDSWLAPDLYNMTFPYDHQSMDEYQSRQVLWMNEPHEDPPASQNFPQNTKAYQQPSDQLFADLSLNVAPGDDEFFVHAQD